MCGKGRGDGKVRSIKVDDDFIERWHGHIGRHRIRQNGWMLFRRETRFIGDSTYTVHADIANRAIRIDWDRDMQFVSVERLQYSELVHQNYGVVIDNKGMRPMSGIRLASHQREYMRGSPFMMLRALENPRAVAAAGDQRLNEVAYPAIAFHAGTARYFVLFDRKTKLPVAVRTRDDDHIYGDSDYEVMAPLPRHLIRVG